ncbi:MAG TPA: type II toxin-antitoxin system prevent-host-death family antitoxin, partial [Sulfurimonas sp.]|nr:type II toxin-antitoxin system prevent-host-death family antitoxin [Sulfurimonas sp.]
EARNNLKAVFDAAYNDHEDVIIHRKGNENVVVISFDEYNAMKETQYLMSSQNNKDRLLRSLKDAREGISSDKELIE